MTLLKDNNYKDINVALLSLEADIKNKITNFDTSVIDKQLVEINSRIDKINAGDNNTSAVINDIRYEIEDINTKIKNNSAKIKDIEQKLSDIFSAENKVTDFNTTTNSGIYYWVNDAANKPGTDYGVLLVNKYNGGSAATLWINQIAYGTNNKIYFRQNINSGNWTEWKAVAFDGEGKANFLNEYTGAGGTRPTSGNIVPKDASEYGGMRKDVVTSSMTDSGHPGQDGHLLTMFWDNSGRYDSQFFVSNSNPPTVKARSKANGEDYGPWVDVITSNNIGSQSVASAGNADTVDNYHASDLWRSDGATWNPNANVTMTPSGNGSEWSFDFRNKNGATGTYWQVWDEDKSTLLSVDADSGKVSAPYGFVGNLSGKADTAGTADSLFYRHGNEINFKGGAQTQCWFNYRNADTEGPSPVDTMEYRFCNYSGDTSKSVLMAGSFDGNKLTLHGRTVSSNSYTDTNPKLEFKNNDNSQNISLTFTDFDAVQAPASLTLNGNQGNEYFIAPCIKANSKMVIPIGAPSSLEDGCIWIER